MKENNLNGITFEGDAVEKSKYYNTDFDEGVFEHVKMETSHSLCKGRKPSVKMKSKHNTKPGQVLHFTKDQIRKEYGNMKIPSQYKTKAEKIIWLMKHHGPITANEIKSILSHGSVSPYISYVYKVLENHNLKHEDKSMPDGSTTMAIIRRTRQTRGNPYEYQIHNRISVSTVWRMYKDFVAEISTVTKVREVKITAFPEECTTIARKVIWLMKKHGPISNEMMAESLKKKIKKVGRISTELFAALGENYIMREKMTHRSSRKLRAYRCYHYMIRDNITVEEAHEKYLEHMRVKKRISYQKTGFAMDYIEARNERRKPIEPPEIPCKDHYPVEMARDLGFMPEFESGIKRAKKEIRENIEELLSEYGIDAEVKIRSIDF